MSLFTPLINYAGMEHVLNAMPCFVHPNGNRYGIAIEKRGGVTQNLSVYRMRNGTTAREHVHTYTGGVDSVAQIAAGGCIIRPDGALEVWAAATPVQSPNVTKTGFVGGFWEPIPNVDDPYTLGGSGVTLFPHLMTAPSWENRTVAGGQWVDVPSVFGVPASSAYIVRFVAESDAADVRVRAGTDVSPSFLTVNTQLPNVQIHAQGWAPGPRCWVSVAQGTARVWMQICGYST
jgi:hypothetical protein